MALINCPECKASISNEADKCQHCGAPLTTASQKTRRSAILFGLAAIAVIIGIGALIGDANPPTPETQTQQRRDQFCGTERWQNSVRYAVEQAVYRKLEATVQEPQKYSLRGINGMATPAPGDGCKWEIAVNVSIETNGLRLCQPFVMGSMIYLPAEDDWQITNISGNDCFPAIFGQRR